MSEDRRGKSVGYGDAYLEGYSCKYDQWSNREVPYEEGTEEYNGFVDGYNEACTFAC